jgi:hypothetical protein
MQKSMFRSKTFWTGVITGVASIAKAIGVPIPEELFPALIGLLGIFLRMGVESTKTSITRF